MSTINKTLLWISAILFVVAIVIWASKDQENYFKKVPLSNNNRVLNYTTMGFLDTVAHVAMDTLGLCEVTLYVKPMSQIAKDNLGSNLQLKAYIYGAGDQYILWIDELDRAEAISVMCHEMIHLTQYKTREIYYENMYVYWRGLKYDFKEIPYENRPWEADAFNKQVRLERLVKAKIY